jgi:hypothetical protein
MTTSWQSRLSAKHNVLAQKLIDNSIQLAGTFTDVLVIRTVIDQHTDPDLIKLEDIDTTNMLFPKMEDIPLNRFLGSDYSSDTTSSFLDPEKEEPIVVVAPISVKLDQGSLIVRVFEFPDNIVTNVPVKTQPWVLVLKVADVLGTFGARGMIWQKLNLTYPDTPMSPKIKAYINQIATRRLILKW